MNSNICRKDAKDAKKVKAGLRCFQVVMPAKAGIQECCYDHWIPAFAGMTS